MIRLAFSTLGCPAWPLSRVVDAALAIPAERWAELLEIPS